VPAHNEARLLFARDPRLAYPAIAIKGWHRRAVGLTRLFKINSPTATE
jgi:hypothetical protein